MDLQAHSVLGRKGSMKGIKMLKVERTEASFEDSGQLRRYPDVLVLCSYCGH